MKHSCHFAFNLQFLTDSSFEDQIVLYYLESCRQGLGLEKSKCIQVIEKYIMEIVMCESITHLPYAYICNLLTTPQMISQPNYLRFILIIRFVCHLFFSVHLLFLTIPYHSWLHKDCNSRKVYTSDMLQSINLNDPDIVGVQLCITIVNEYPPLERICIISRFHHVS